MIKTLTVFVSSDNGGWLDNSNPEKYKSAIRPYFQTFLLGLNLYTQSILLLRLCFSLVIHIEVNIILYEILETLEMGCLLFFITDLFYI